MAMNSDSMNASVDWTASNGGVPLAAGASTTVATTTAATGSSLASRRSTWDEPNFNQRSSTSRRSRTSKSGSPPSRSDRSSSKKEKKKMNGSRGHSSMGDFHFQNSSSSLEKPSTQIRHRHSATARTDTIMEGFASEVAGSSTAIAAHPKEEPLYESLLRYHREQQLKSENDKDEYAGASRNEARRKELDRVGASASAGAATSSGGAGGFPSAGGFPGGGVGVEQTNKDPPRKAKKSQMPTHMKDDDDCSDVSDRKPAAKVGAPKPPPTMENSAGARKRSIALHAPGAPQPQPRRRDSDGDEFDEDRGDRPLPSREDLAQSSSTATKPRPPHMHPSRRLSSRLHSEQPGKPSEGRKMGHSDDSPGGTATTASVSASSSNNSSPLNGDLAKHRDTARITASHEQAFLESSPAPPPDTRALERQSSFYRSLIEVANAEENQQKQHQQKQQQEDHHQQPSSKHASHATFKNDFSDPNLDVKIGPAKPELSRSYTDPAHDAVFYTRERRSGLADRDGFGSAVAATATATAAARIAPEFAQFFEDESAAAAAIGKRDMESLARDEELARQIEEQLKMEEQQLKLEEEQKALRDEQLAFELSRQEEEEKKKKAEQLLSDTVLAARAAASTSQNLHTPPTGLPDDVVLAAAMSTQNPAVAGAALPALSEQARILERIRQEQEHKDLELALRESSSTIAFDNINEPSRRNSFPLRALSGSSLPVVGAGAGAGPAAGVAAAGVAAAPPPPGGDDFLLSQQLALQEWTQQQDRSRTHHQYQQERFNGIPLPLQQQPPPSHERDISAREMIPRTAQSGMNPMHEQGGALEQEQEFMHHSYHPSSPSTPLAARPDAGVAMPVGPMRRQSHSSIPSRGDHLRNFPQQQEPHPKPAPRDPYAHSGLLRLSIPAARQSMTSATGAPGPAERFPPYQQDQYTATKLPRKIPALSGQRPLHDQQFLQQQFQQQQIQQSQQQQQQQLGRPLPPTTAKPVQSQSRSMVASVPGNPPTPGTTLQAHPSDEILRRGNIETRMAMDSGASHVVQCQGCRARLHAPMSYSLVFCPNCRTVSPGQTAPPSSSAIRSSSVVVNRIAPPAADTSGAASGGSNNGTNRVGASKSKSPPRERYRR